MSTEAGIDVQQELEERIHEFRTSDPPMPVVVVHAEDGGDDGAVFTLVKELAEVQREHRSWCAVVDAEVCGEGDDPTARAASLLRDLSGWDGTARFPGRRSALYRRYAFPRLHLIQAIEDAARSEGGEWSRSEDGRQSSEADETQRKLLKQLAKQRWRPAAVPGSRARLRAGFGLRFVDMGNVLPASVVAGLGALFARSEWYASLGWGLGILLVLILLNHMPGRAPLFLWLRRESKWFLTTTFLSVASREQPTDTSILRPVRSWKAIASRAYDVAGWLLDEREGSRIQLYVLAMLEDLRDSHTRWSWDLRGFKRSRPPLLFLPRISNSNGGIELIRAISDVRSRRSELDPLLVLAGVAAQDVERLEPRAGSAGAPGPEPARAEGLSRMRVRYRDWAASLRSTQSPSGESTLPWVLTLPLPSHELRALRERDRHCVKASNRPTVARVVWALHSLVAVACLAAALMGWRALALDREYCAAGFLTANKYTEKEESGRGDEMECIGLATGGVRFSDWLSHDQDAQENAQKPASWTVAGLEEAVRDENKEVREGSGPFVTVVYAGPLSSDPDGAPSPVKGIEELAGVHIAQKAINDTSSRKLRVLVANGGVDMQHQVTMADKIAAYADTDPTLIGVVGIGRNLRSGEETVERLAAAGLPVVSGTNSSSELPKKFANWFSLAAPDDWQARQLGLVAAQLRKPGSDQSALVLARKQPDKGAGTHKEREGRTDAYTRDQARFGEQMLARKGFRMQKPLAYEVSNGTPQMGEQAAAICKDQGEIQGQGRSRDVPTVIYFAGRVEDLRSLMSELSEEKGCRKDMTILTGDDLSKARFAPDRERVGPNVTLYHVALAKMNGPGDTDFYADARKTFPESFRGEVGPKSPELSSGQAALSHDATKALHTAAGKAPHNRAATWVNLRNVSVKSLATGTIDFTKAPLYKSREGHSIALVEVRREEGSDTYRSAEVCSRSAGDTAPLTVQDCRISAPASSK
ncbi:ABC transporter substrate-binding protein [Streptomyces sp. G5(2025)]|uniref:ABC transporter substrate-binding protein n=1 Tax=Streptomyces sp. G5(2025) TaxID=3406628 RepID=UPI003C1734E4